MKKVLIPILMMVCAFTAAAQADLSKMRIQAERPSAPIYVGVQGSMLMSVNENVFSYVDNRRVPDLLTAQGGMQIGYYFSNRWSMRLAAAIGSNAGACNTANTSAHGFYPYRFKSVNAFIDVVHDFISRGDGEELRFFYPKIYAGLGYAHTWDFTDSGHPWQEVDPENNEFGFRIGAIGEFAVNRTVGFYVDLCGEGYGDQYNGLQPTVADQGIKEGYAGFPLDLRLVASLGIVFHF